MSDKLKQCIDYMSKRGCDSISIRNSFVENLSNNELQDEFLKFASLNPSATPREIAFEVHRIHLKSRGIII